MTVINQLKNNIQRPHFWTMQLSFWLFFSVISLFTLTLWYAELGWGHIVHTILQSMLGLLMSLPLFWVFMRIWDKPILLRLTVSISFVLFIALVWTIIRMYLFSWIIGEENLWVELGGWYFSSIFVFLCWAGLCHGIKYYYLLQKEHIFMLDAEAQAKTEQLKRERAQTAARDAKIKMLRYQLNPHFLFNTMNAISTLIYKHENDKANEMLDKLCEFFRYSLDKNEKSTSTLRKELALLDLYLSIEKVRFSSRLTIEMTVDNETLECQVPSMLLQPIVENAIKYAVEPHKTGGTIHIKAYKQHQRLLIQVIDEGQGFHEKVKEGFGIGMTNTKARLGAMFNGDFDVSITKDEHQGTTVSLTIPFMKNSTQGSFKYEY